MITNEFYRTLVRFVNIDDDFVHVIVPGWNSNQTVKIALKLIPEDILDEYVPNLRCHAKVNLSAESKDKLIFKDWEI